MHLWPLRKLAVFFVPEAETRTTGGTTNTKLEACKVIYLRIVLDDKDLAGPAIFFGVLSGFEKRNAAGEWPTKFEHLMAHLGSQRRQGVQEPRCHRLSGRPDTLPRPAPQGHMYDITDTEQISTESSRRR